MRQARLTKVIGVVVTAMLAVGCSTKGFVEGAVGDCIAIDGRLLGVLAVDGVYADGQRVADLELSADREGLNTTMIAPVDGGRHPLADVRTACP